MSALPDTGATIAKPIAILQFAARCPAGLFEAWAADSGYATAQVDVFAGDAVPATSEPFSGICLLGGEMSVNDPLAWIEPVCALIRDADARGVPAIGHCLGGQLIARAFGARVAPNALKELGWTTLEPADADLAREWLGEAASFETFQWHGDRFELPRGARRLFTNAWCDNQAYVLPASGDASAVHLGMQCHVEVTPEIIDGWIEVGRGEIADASGVACVQSEDEMRVAMPARVARMGRVAQRLYDRWAQGLRA